MKRKKILVISIVSGLVLFFTLPVLVKDKVSDILYGPSLSELEYTEVVFTNGEIDLAGMLFLPETPGPHPVVVFIHGSGTSSRDNPWYLTFVNYFQKNGIASLLPDKRGSVKSEGNWRTSSFYDLAEDTLAAVDYITRQDLFVYSYIGLSGMSQGGHIAPIAAEQDERVSFVINVSGSAVTMEEQLVHEEINTISNMGVYRFIAKLIAPLSAASIMNRRQKEFWDNIRSHDPLQHWRNLRIPVFVAYGEEDEYDNVPVAESTVRLNTIKETHDLDIIVKVYSGGGHAVEDPETHTVQQELLDDLVEFIGHSVP